MRRCAACENEAAVTQPQRCECAPQYRADSAMLAQRRPPVTPVHRVLSQRQPNADCRHGTSPATMSRRAYRQQSDSKKKPSRHANNVCARVGPAERFIVEGRTEGRSQMAQPRRGHAFTQVVFYIEFFTGDQKQLSLHSFPSFFMIYNTEMSEYASFFSLPQSCKQDFPRHSLHC